MSESLKPLTHWMEKAAQLWCLPKHRKKEMDSDLAFSIAELCLDAYNEGRRASPASPAIVEAERVLAKVEKWFQEIPPSDWRVPTGLWDEVEAALAVLRQQDAAKESHD